MPPEWIIKLQEAALLCDEEAVLSLIQEIPPEQETLANGLRALARDFQFQQIRQLTFGENTPDSPPI
jgi:hypothetical protein